MVVVWHIGRACEGSSQEGCRTWSRQGTEQGSSLDTEGPGGWWCGTLAVACVDAQTLWMTPTLQTGRVYARLA